MMTIGWFTILASMFNVIDSIEYFIGSMNGVYNDAINICYDDGGILGVIINEYEFNIARELCRNNGLSCWIGLNRLNIDNEWRYIDGTSVKGIYGFDINGNPTTGIGPWGNDEPNNQDIDGSERCIHFNIDTQYMWNDKSCSNIYSPLCMRNQNKYFIGSTSSDNYTDAINYCSNNGAVLATIVSQNDYIDAQNICNNRDCWIGLNRVINENVWQYMDGTSVNGTYGFDLDGNPTYGTGPWDVNQPDDDVYNEACVQFSILDNNKWSDRPCWADYLIPLCMRNEKQTRNIYSHVGCYGDTPNRAMRHHDSFRSHTPQSCYVYCTGYMYFGIQFGHECYCDNDFNHSTKYGVSNNCQNGVGGQWSNSIYYIITHPTVSPTPTPTSSPTLSPTLSPTNYPSIEPSVYPTIETTETELSSTKWTILIAGLVGLVGLGGCVTLLILIYMLAKKIYSKSQNGMKKDQDLGSIAHANNGNIGINNIDRAIAVTGNKQKTVSICDDNDVYFLMEPKGFKISDENEIEMKADLSKIYKDNEIITKDDNQINNDQIISQELNKNNIDIFLLTKGQISRKEFITQK